MKRLSRALLHAVVCAVALGVGAMISRPAHAQPKEAPLVLTREQAASLGASQGPGVAVERAPRAAALRAGEVANPIFMIPPRVTVAAGRRAGSMGAGSYGTGFELSVTAIEEVPLRAIGRERGRTADGLKRVAETSARSMELDAGTRAALAWATVLETKHTLELRHSSLRDADELLRLAQARVTSGVALPIELASARGERGAAAAGELDAEGLLTESLFELRYATGVRADAPVDVDGDLERIVNDEPDVEALLRVAAASHPAIHVATARADLAAQEAHLAFAVRAPTIGLGASYLHEGTGNEVWSGILVAPLPFGDFGDFDRARQDVLAARVHAEVDVVRSRLERDVRMAMHERHHARETYVALVTGAREPLREAVRLARVQYEAGPGDLSSVLLARQRLLLAEEQVTRAAANVQRADIRLAQASGTLLGRSKR
jgi:cobalt-zinc-cadmium efflux system outer membrane protein